MNLKENIKRHFIYLICLQILSCSNNNNLKNMDSTYLKIEKAPFGKTSDGIEVDQFIMKNGMKVGEITYGGIIHFLTARDKNDYKDILLGYDNLAQYEASDAYFGAIIGRYGNRIAGGKFDLNDESYQLAKKIIAENSALIELRYLSKDMEEGYPGNPEVKVTYTLDNNDQLTVNYEANTDKTFIINLTQYSYFNLTGDFKNDILDYEMVINADSFLPVNSELIPTGKFQDVLGTPFDFRNSKTIRRDINIIDDQLKNGLGYDHCWVLNDQIQRFRFVASAHEPNSGRLLEKYSDEPGIQFYSGNFLVGTLPSKRGGNYNFRTGFCIENQHFPDSPNQKNFPTVELNPGEKYFSKTLFKFSVR